MIIRIFFRINPKLLLSVAFVLLLMRYYLFYGVSKRIKWL